VKRCLRALNLWPSQVTPSKGAAGSDSDVVEVSPAPAPKPPVSKPAAKVRTRRQARWAVAQGA
jgi:hypothetical protein